MLIQAGESLNELHRLRGTVARPDASTEQQSPGTTVSKQRISLPLNALFQPSVFLAKYELISDLVDHLCKEN